MTYDVIVIGSGPGGYSAAVRAGQYGLKTALIEKDAETGRRLPARRLHSHQVFPAHRRCLGAFPALRGRRHPLRKSAPRFPPGHRPQEQDRRQARQGRRVPDEEEQGRRIKGYGRLAGPGKVEVTAADGAKQIVETKNIVLATGSEARMLPGLQPDAERILTNIEILNLTDVPKSLAILGAGAVGVEFASCFHRFGIEGHASSKCCRASCRSRTRKSRRNWSASSRSSGIRVETGAKVEQRPEHRQRRALHRRRSPTANDETVEADALLVAVGRKPNTENIGLEGTRVAARSRLHQGGPVPAHRRAGRLRHRRYRRRNAAAGARRHGRRHGRDRAHRRQAGHAHQQESHPGRDLHRAGHRQRRPHRSAGARRRATT